MPLPTKKIKDLFKKTQKNEDNYIKIPKSKFNETMADDGAKELTPIKTIDIDLNNISKEMDRFLPPTGRKPIPLTEKEKKEILKKWIENYGPAKISSKEK